MKGTFTAKVIELTVLGRMNDVNVQVKIEVDYPEGVSGIDVVDQITKRWHAGGLEAPVRPNGAKPYKTIGEQNGATGRHPADMVPQLTNSGEPFKCPHCGKQTYHLEGITQKKESPNFGQKWEKWVCPKSVGGCGAYNFGDRKDARFDN